MQTIELSSDQLRAMAETTAAIAGLNHRAAGMRKSQHLPVKFCSPLSSLLFLLDATSRGLKLSSPVRVKEASVLLALLFISESVYWAKEETELNILNGRFKYDARKWKGVSKSSFDFVSKLLLGDISFVCKLGSVCSSRTSACGTPPAREHVDRKHRQPKVAKRSRPTNDCGAGPLLVAPGIMTRSFCPMCEGLLKPRGLRELSVHFP